MISPTVLQLCNARPMHCFSHYPQCNLAAAGNHLNHLFILYWASSGSTKGYFILLISYAKLCLMSKIDQFTLNSMSVLTHGIEHEIKY